MNKTFQRIFAKAKSENKSCFVGFVTGMDPDYESSKQILIELSKYCSVLEIGVSFNTSTSDSSIIMSANDRAIKSGAKTEKIFQLIKEIKKRKNPRENHLIHLCGSGESNVARMLKYKKDNE